MIDLLAYSLHNLLKDETFETLLKKVQHQSCIIYCVIQFEPDSENEHLDILK